MRTQDLGGYATTQDFTAAVVKVSNSIVGGVQHFCGKQWNRNENLFLRKSAQRSCWIKLSLMWLKPWWACHVRFEYNHCSIRKAGDWRCWQNQILNVYIVAFPQNGSSDMRVHVWAKTEGERLVNIFQKDIDRMDKDLKDNKRGNVSTISQNWAKT